MSIPPTRRLTDPTAESLRILATMSDATMRVAAVFRRKVLAAGRVTEQDIVTYARLVRTVRLNIAMETTIYGPRRRRRRRSASDHDESLLGDLVSDLEKERGDRPFSKVLTDVSEALARIGKQVRSGNRNDPTE